MIGTNERADDALPIAARDKFMGRFTLDRVVTICEIVAEEKPPADRQSLRLALLVNPTGPASGPRKNSNTQGTLACGVVVVAAVVVVARVVVVVGGGAV